MPRVRYSERFINDVSAIYSEKVLSELDGVLATIEEFPEIGSEQVRESLVRQFGGGLRKFPVSSFVIVYRYQPGNDEIGFIALPYGPSVP
ncbi:type II toxin-antitoxin system RelE/ParE family toxin [Curtanaerobium respiraculi]|uniref:type II toxin-antitoxin system RelE/ParE family toxin n=1 Tax=Curtanaerobium respiraculi TaxID=2949669 RepID=UPI003D185D03